MRNIFYFFKEAIRGLLGAWLLTGVSIVTTGASLFVLGAIILIYSNFNHFWKQTDKGATVVVFLTDSLAAHADRVREVQTSIDRHPAVLATRVVDKDDAWNRFASLYGADMLDAVAGNPLPASIEVTIAPRYHSNDSLIDAQSAWERLPGVEGLSYSHEWFNQLRWLQTLIVAAGVITFAVVFLALFLMISNTIKLTIYARKDLISNMFYVGATQWYIKAPFVLEGMLQGLIGSLVSVGLLALARTLAGSSVAILQDWFPFLIVVPIGVLFGCVGSVSAVRKFINS